MDLSKDYGFIEKSSQQGLKPILDSILNKFSINDAEIFFHQIGDVKKINKQTINHSICYKKKEIGLLQIPNSNSLNYPASKKFPDICKKINLLVNRYITNKKSHLFLGQCEDFIGVSEYILAIEDFIEKSANSDYPVIISGQSGCEKLAVASAIHCYSNKNKMPFREFNCVTKQEDDFEEELYHLINSVKQGTIYLSEIENLTLKQQQVLANFLAAKSAHILKNENTINHDIRFIVSSSKDLSSEVINNNFSEKILESFNFLNIEVPCLKERKEDIPYIINVFSLEKDEQIRKCFTTEALQVLKEYDWPGNYRELERTIAQLITLTEKEVISVDDIKQHTPNIFNKKSNKTLQDNRLIQDLLAKRNDSYQYLHTGLKRSLDHIAENYNQDITLADLSDSAFVSPSHLSYLFRHHLGRSFKQILSELRIEKVKEIFSTEPNKKITVASLEVGFGDLSHFEKIFKRYTDMTPREYKKKINIY